MEFRFLYLYQVISNYPWARYTNGMTVREKYDGIDMLLNTDHLFIPECYPKLFKRLPWHYNLEKDDYPEYIKINNHIVKIRWINDSSNEYSSAVAIHDENQLFFRMDIEPATEYQFLNQYK